MGKSESGFDRALREESERRRRKKVREAEELEVYLDDDAIKELCQRMTEFLQRGRGDNGKGLTFQAISDYFREVLDGLTGEPTEEDEALEQALGIPAPRRRRRPGDEPSNEEFLRDLLGCIRSW
jgi:hypothetical protein